MRSALQRKVWHVDFFLLFVFLLGLSLRSLGGMGYVRTLGGGGGRIVFLGYCSNYRDTNWRRKSTERRYDVSIDV